MAFGTLGLLYNDNNNTTVITVIFIDCLLWSWHCTVCFT